MATVGAYEAKTHLSSLLERVQRGEEITITRHGMPIAKLVPIGESGRKDARDIIREMRELRKHSRLDGLSIREMIEEGRRY
jgi:prevent-host-death family protein